MNPVARMGRLKINLDYLPIKAHYFLYFAGTASLWPFISVFAKQVGISEEGVTYIFGVAPIAGLLCKLLFGAVADHFKRKKKLFIFFILLNLMSYICVAFIPLSTPVRPVTLDCALGTSVFRQNDRLKCSTDVIEPFLPEEVQRTHQAKREREQADRDNQRITTRVKKAVIENGMYIEYCFAECAVFEDIETFLQADEFCNNIISSNVPELCHQLRNHTARTNNSNDTAQTANQWIRNAAKSSYPPTLTMNVKLKITEATAVGQDLFLPIGDISFAEDPNEYSGLSCHSKSSLEACFLNCPNNTALNRQLELVLAEPTVTKSRNFWLYGSLVVIGWCAMAVVCSLGDALCFEVLGDKPELYGHQRQWGAFGWGAFSLIAGYLIDEASGARVLKDYSPCFYLLGGLLTLDIIIAYKWDIREVEKPKSIRRDVCFLLSDIRIIVFIFACVVVGMCTGLLWTFLFWHVEFLAGQNSASCESPYVNLKLLEGLIVAVQCFGGEVPFFHFSGWFIKKLGHVNCMTLVLFAFGVRFIIYSLITNPWMVLPVELFQGVTFGVFYATMASYASKVSPPGIAATVQGIVGSAFEGVGVSMGSLLGGMLYSANGSGVIAFRLFGIGAIVFSLIHLLAMFILSRKVSYGLPVDRAEQEGQEMFRMSGSAQDVDSE